MPKSDSVNRIRNYDLKVTPARIAELVEKRKTEMVNKQTEAVKDLYRIEMRVKEVLATEPVGVMEYLAYYNFAREVYRCQKEHVAGYGLVHEVQILIDKWAARKCDERILHRIRFEVFTIQSEEEFQVVLAHPIDPRTARGGAAAAGTPAAGPKGKARKIKNTKTEAADAATESTGETQRAQRGPERPQPS